MKTTVGILVNLIPWKIYFDKITSVVQLLIQSDGWIIMFAKSSYQRDLFLSGIKRIKPFNGKVEQRDTT